MLRQLTKICLSLLAICVTVNADATTRDSIEAVGIPAGFSELARPRESMVDVYFGGRKIGEARLTVRPGFVRFRDPDQILTLIPNLITSPILGAAAATELPANAGRICPSGITLNCGELSPALFGVIFDEDRFRLDVFVNPMWLRPVGSDEERYLATPAAPLSLTSSMGLALSGSSATSPVYNFQNRTILAFRNGRIRSDTSYASKLGLLLDNAVAEIDSPGLRYSAGLFWAPGLDLTGQRRILGLGIGTQFDTRVDRDELRGTPLVLFLSQPARVDILIDGRLVGSALYEAGNNILNTSGMPDGSYSVLLRIQERNGAVREERRFFAKTPQIAPVGQPIYFGYAGMLANTRPGRPISLSNDIFYQFGAARRLNESFAADASIIGTGKRPMIELGGWLITRMARVRAAGLISAAGDRAALLQVASAQTGRLMINFDLRRVWSRRNEPLLPLSNYVESFDSAPLASGQMGEGSYAQASGSIGYRLGEAYLSVIGSLRKDKGLPADFSIGPNLNWPIINSNGLQVVLQADAQRTRTSTAGYVGVRMMFTSRGYSASSSAGHRALSGRGGSGGMHSRAVASTTAQYSYHNNNQTELSLAAGLDREIESTTARAGGALYSRFGNVRGEISHQFEGDKRTQYALTLQTGAVFNRDDVVLGGRNLEQSALVVSLAGTSGDSEFEVLVNEQPRGRVKAGERLPIFLQPYRAYGVRIRPVDAASVWFDPAPREVTLYPGNVQHVRWQAEQLVTVFGRAVRANGMPIANWLVTSKRGIGQSDADGYFQIEVTANETLSFAANENESCNVTVGTLEVRNDFAALGRVVCR